MVDDVRTDERKVKEKENMWDRNCKHEKRKECVAQKSFENKKKGRGLNGCACSSDTEH